MNSALETSPTRLKVVANILATQDDFCLSESIEQLHSEGITNFAVCNPRKYWSGHPVPVDVTTDLLAKLKVLVGRLPGVRIFYLPVPKSPFGENIPGGAREQLIRQFMLEESVKLFKADAVILIDADELWLPGEATRAVNFFEQLPAASALAVGFQNVVGVPGWLVSPDSSTGVVLVRAGSTFSGPRSVAAVSRLEGTSVYHFTATRATWPEVVNKYATSGHQGDPNYDFAKFLVKVGHIAQNPESAARLTDFHPDVRTPQTWPAVRAFSQKELDLLPARLRPFLQAG